MFIDLARRGLLIAYNYLVLTLIDKSTMSEKMSLYLDLFHHAQT